MKINLLLVIALYALFFINEVQAYAWTYNYTFSESQARSLYPMVEEGSVATYLSITTGIPFGTSGIPGTLQTNNSIRAKIFIPPGTWRIGTGGEYNTGNADGQGDGITLGKIFIEDPNDLADPFADAQALTSTRAIIDPPLVFAPVSTGQYVYIIFKPVKGVLFPTSGGIGIDLSVTDVNAYRAWKVGKYALTLNKTDGSTDGSFMCTTVANPTSAPCANSYDVNSEVTITATSTTATFSGWTGDCTGVDPKITLKMDKSKTCTATFTKKPANNKLKLTVNGAGKITSSDGIYNIDCLTTVPCTAATNFKELSHVSENDLKITATPSDNNGFTWGEDCKSSAGAVDLTKNPISLSFGESGIPTNRTCTVTFGVKSSGSPDVGTTPIITPITSPVFMFGGADITDSVKKDATIQLAMRIDGEGLTRHWLNEKTEGFELQGIYPIIKEGNTLTMNAIVENPAAKTNGVPLDIVVLVGWVGEKTISNDPLGMAKEATWMQMVKSCIESPINKNGNGNGRFDFSKFATKVDEINNTPGCWMSTSLENIATGNLASDAKLYTTAFLPFSFSLGSDKIIAPTGLGKNRRAMVVVGYRPSNIPDFASNFVLGVPPAGMIFSVPDDPNPLLLSKDKPFELGSPNSSCDTDITISGDAVPKKITVETKTSKLGTGIRTECWVTGNQETVEADNIILSFTFKVDTGTKTEKYKVTVSPPSTPAAPATTR